MQGDQPVSSAGFDGAAGRLNTESSVNKIEAPAGRLRTADLLGALSLAADLAVGLPAEHAFRSCYIGMRIADQLGLPPDQRADVYYAHLLMDVGCTAWTSQLAGSILSDDIEARRQLVFSSDPNNPFAMLGWLTAYMAPDAPALTRMKRGLNFALQGRAFAREGFRNTCEVAHRFAERLGMSAAVQEAQTLVRSTAARQSQDRIVGAARAGRARWPAGLSDREVEILRLLAKGLSRRQVAETLFLSEHTVRHHLEHIYDKLGVSTRVAAALFVIEHGLLS